MILRDYYTHKELSRILKPCGVYMIRNTVTDRVYIGSSARLPGRLYSHMSEIKYQRHTNPGLSADCKIYAFETFEFHVLEQYDAMDTADLHKLEEYYMDQHRRRLYNATPHAGTSLGVRYNDQVRQRLQKCVQTKMNSADYKGRKNSLKYIKSLPLAVIHRRMNNDPSFARRVRELLGSDTSHFLKQEGQVLEAIKKPKREHRGHVPDKVKKASVAKPKGQALQLELTL